MMYMGFASRSGAPTPYTIEKHALWCLFLAGKALPVGRYARLEEALAATVSHMRQGSQRGGNGSNPT
jgi:hypothetical protein